MSTAPEKKEISVAKKDGAERLPDDSSGIRIGQWYWIKSDSKEDDWNGRGEWFACVTEVGSNYAEVTSPGGGGVRIHFDEFVKECRPESTPEAVINERINRYRSEVQSKLSEIKDVMARLGIADYQKLEGGSTSPVAESSRSLSVLSGTDNVKGYKKDLVKAKDKLLPKLFEEVKEANKKLAEWMSAESLPLRGMADGLSDAVEQIEGRIFNVSLYAGLTEETVQITKGIPAAATEKLRILQRLHYMDEESLLDYRHGGMDVKKIGDFDKWLAKPSNRDRILPFERTIAAFRVRRHTKERDWGGEISTLFINFELEQADKFTFLYIRNGENLYRMSCDLDFGELIFPSKNELNLSEPMMARMFCSRVEELISKREFETLAEKNEERKLKLAEWQKANPEKEWIDEPSELRHSSFEHDRYQPFDSSSVYFDEIASTIKKRIEHWNRIALIVQGLFDRSEILHPHSPVALWKPDGFEAAVELVYDGSNLLHYGEAPDFESYRQACNMAIAKGAITIGQDDFWQEREARRHNASRSWRDRERYEYDRYKPYGDAGPGYFAIVADWRAKKTAAVFRWTRERRRSVWGADGDVPVSIAVPESRLFCVNSYKLGDYRRFYVDPRTRSAYLQWAPMLLAAEEYTAGNLNMDGTWKRKKAGR